MAKKNLLRSTIRVDDKATIDILKRLVRINSVNPDIGGGPGEAEIGNEIAKMLESYGLEVRTQKVSGERFNVVGVLRGEGHGRDLMLNGHMDTVGISNMETPAFKPVVRAGLLYGRGSCDMKGGLAGMISALKAIADSKLKLKGDLYISAVADEEYVSAGSEKVVAEYKTDAAIVGEPTRMGVAIAHMGYLWIEIETIGRTAHGSVPERGHDAIVDMARIIAEIELLKVSHEKRKQRLLGAPKLHTSTIVGGQGWSIVPDYCRLWIERRTLPDEVTEDCMKEIRRAIGNVKSKHSALNASVTLKLERPPLEIAETAEISQSTARASEIVTGKRAAFVGVTYWSDASIFLNEGRVPTCLFGPGDIGLAHSPLEYVPVREVEASARVYALAAALFCGTNRHPD